MSSLARRFYTDFCEGFEAECERSRESLLATWKDKPAWTKFMLAQATGFLPRFVQAWATTNWNEDCQPRAEWLKFDLMLVSVTAGKEWWQSVPLVTLEHENDNNIQDEVWKLACWKSRLKVLVTYHDSAFQAEQKRELAASIIRNIGESYDDRTEWLVLSALRLWESSGLAWQGDEWQTDRWSRL